MKSSKIQYKYFCDSCGARFESETPFYTKDGLHSEISCPHCGAWDIYEDTAAGAAESVRALTEYENRISEWEED